MNDFRERLQKAATRVGVGESQASIADALSLNRQTINRWFQGGEPNADMLLHAAKTLGVDAEWLKSGNGEMLPRPDELPDDERDLLKNYRSASADARRSIQTIVRSLRKSVVTIAVSIPPLLAAQGDGAPILHNQNSVTAFAASGLGRITHWILSGLRKFAPILFVAMAACSTQEYVQVAYVETPQSDLVKVCPRLIGTSGGCVVHKAGVAYIYAPAPRDVKDEFALYVLGHEFYCHAWLNLSHTDEQGVRRDPDKDCNREAAKL